MLFDDVVVPLLFLLDVAIPVLRNNLVNVPNRIFMPSREDVAIGKITQKARISIPILHV
ncbi:MAG: hypothetical protein RRA35_08665 [Desulfomonilia bacterium]|nr:hypothetical protein [Desulfomonilia bacterium]